MTTTTTMPYNTRRKSLSLSELGITVPKRSRTQSHPSPPSTLVEGDERPVKKSKRSHASDSPPAGLMSPPRTTTIRVKEEKPRRPPVALSPPPSPAREGSHRVDAEGINDDIVVAAIRQLEQTGNRPHLVKELAAVLATQLHCIEKSANPCALISSRLTAYLHRHWPAVSPCPLAKDLSPVHPRRLYFYLTTTPHQPIPEVAEPEPKPNRIITPSLSSASAADEEEDERYNRQRAALSPSPEVDLSSPELEDEITDDPPPTPGAPFSGRSSVSRERSASATNLSRNRRAASPQLEHEERDFKQTASQLQAQRRNSQHSRQQSQDVRMGDAGDAVVGAEHDTALATTEESEESAARKNSEAAADLFGQTAHLRSWGAEAHAMEFSSPVIPARTAANARREEPMVLDLDAVRGKGGEAALVAADWEQLQSPETIDVAELDDMFDAY